MLSLALGAGQQHSPRRPDADCQPHGLSGQAQGERVCFPYTPHYGAKIEGWARHLQSMCTTSRLLLPALGALKSHTRYMLGRVN